MEQPKFLRYLEGESILGEADSALNAYGTLVALYDDQSKIPVMCGHGGSNWLCWSCKESILMKQEDAAGISRRTAHFTPEQITNIQLRSSIEAWNDHLSRSWDKYEWDKSWWDRLLRFFGVRG